MLLLAAEGAGPLGHVLDKNLVGGPNALIMPGGTPIITMHMVTLVVAAFLMYWLLKAAAAAISTGPESEGNGRYRTKGRLSQMVEVITLYLRDNIVKPVLGEQSNKYMPFLMTVFFFILLNNLLGLVPLLDLQHLIGSAWGDSHFAVVGGTATGNLAVTAALALIAFIVIQVHGFRELGVVGWCKHLTAGAPWFVAPLMVVVELLSLFIKPAALAIRLFANMLAGHTLLAVIAGFGVMAYSGLNSVLAGAGVSIVAGLFAVAIGFLELFVAFLQAFIFMFLTAIFIAQLSHHDDHEHEHDAEVAHA
jgi:F-type H+-transporting ATPase subunit a